MPMFHGKTHLATMIPANHIYPDAEVRHELEQQGDTKTAFGDKSPGVRRIEAISQCFTSTHLYVLFISIFSVACECLGAACAKW